MYIIDKRCLKDMRLNKYQEKDKKKSNKPLIKSMVIFIVVYTIILLLLIWLSHKYYVPAEM